MPDYILVTCEHGGNRIPRAYAPLFRNKRRLLDSHRGYDPGALLMARELAAALQAPLVSSTVSRLLVDLNRSLGHPRLHLHTVSAAGAEIRATIVRRYYRPYRDCAESLVAAAIAARHRVIHISSHSFTPNLDGQMRTADVGLLYDPARGGELALCARWQTALRARAPELSVRRNYPYAGKGDGLTRTLRARYAPDRYIGVELEINQKHALESARRWRWLRRLVVSALCEALGRGNLVGS